MRSCSESIGKREEMGMTAVADRAVPRVRAESATLHANLADPLVPEIRVTKKSRVSLPECCWPKYYYHQTTRTVFLSYVIYVGSQENSFKPFKILHASTCVYSQSLSGILVFETCYGSTWSDSSDMLLHKFRLGR